MDGNPPTHDHARRQLATVRPDPAGGSATVPIRRLPALQPMVLALLLLACLYTLYFAQGIVVPMVGAIILKLLLAPLLRFLVRWHLPRHAAAALIIFTLIGGLAYGLYSLWEPANEWRLRMPQLLYEMEIKLEALKKPVEDVTRASEEVERIANLEVIDTLPEEVVVKSPSLTARILAGIRDLWGQILIVCILLYFLLASDNLFKEKLVRVMRTLARKKQVVTILRQVEKEVSTYLLTITVINIGLGCAIGVGLQLAGLPNAAMWGVMAALLNFFPYVGALIGAAMVAVVGLLSFDSLAPALVPPAIYIGINILESQFLTPNVLGQRFTLNPVIIFTAVVFWGWMWGVWGALLAVPILVIVKAFCDHLDALAGLGEVLKGRTGPRRAGRPPAAKFRN